MNLEELHQNALKATKFASEIALKYQSKIASNKKIVQTKKDSKNYESLVTEADKKINKYLTDELLKLSLDAGVIAEEGFDPTNKRFQWVIDPIDGTSSFVNNMDHYGICVALWDGTEPVYGLMYFPALNGKYIYAIKGSGAFVFDAGSEKRIVKDSSNYFKYITFAFPTDNIDLYLQVYKNLKINKYKIYSFRACSFETFNLFTTNMAASIMLRHGLWDVSASMVIGKELGLTVKVLNQKIIKPSGTQTYDVIIGIEKEVKNICKLLEF